MAKILVVDDSQSALLAATQIIEKIGHTAVGAANGEYGLNALKENKDIKLVLADFHMPIMNGHEMVKKIREEQEYNHIPIVMVTTESQKERVLSMAKIGIQGWIIKPPTEETITNVLVKLNI